MDYEGNKYLLLTKFPNSYFFQIKNPDNGKVIHIELGPVQVKRLVKNLTEALEINNHIKKNP